MDVELAEGGQERVRVAQGERVAVGIGDLELVVERKIGAVDGGLEDPRCVDLLGLDHLAAGSHEHALGGRAERAHDDSAVAAVGTQHGVRVREPALDELVEVGHLHVRLTASGHLDT